MLGAVVPETTFVNGSSTAACVCVAASDRSAAQKVRFVDSFVSNCFQEGQACPVGSHILWQEQLGRRARVVGGGGLFVYVCLTVCVQVRVRGWITYVCFYLCTYMFELGISPPCCYVYYDNMEDNHFCL